MSKVQLKKRFALLVQNLSKWQYAFLGHWVLDIGHLFVSPCRGLPDASHSAGGASLGYGDIAGTDVSGSAARSYIY